MTRVTDQWIGYLQTSSLNRVENQSARDSQIASSGLKNVDASDDPVWAATLASNDQQSSQLQMYLNNQSVAQNQLTASDTALGSATSILQNIYSLSVQMGSDTVDAQSRASAANTLQALQDSLTGVANTQVAGKYLFAGNKSSTQPFTSTGAFVGDNGTQQVEIQNGEYVTSNASGANAFTGAGGIDVFGAINALKAALQSNNGTAIRAQISTLSSSIDQVDATRSSLGAQMNQITAAQSQVTDQQTLVAQVRAQSVEADSITAYSNLAQAQQSVTSALTVASKMFSNTLLSYLR